MTYRRGILTAFALLSAACGGGGERIVVEDPWARPTSGSGPAAAYLSIANHGEREDRLLGARSSCCSTIEIHQTRLSEGRMSMVPIDEGLAIEPGSSVGLAPGGYHLMLFDLSGPLREGESFTITLQFEVAGDVPVDVRIRR